MERQGSRSIGGNRPPVRAGGFLSEAVTNSEPERPAPNRQIEVVSPEDVAAALAILAARLDPPAANRFRDARPEEKLRLVRDAAAFQASLAADEQEMTRPLTNSEAAVLAEIETAAHEAPDLRARFEEPEDRGLAVLSDLGEVEYVEDLVRPGRIVIVAAEEGTGKSYAITGELGIRVAVAGGSFAGTWPVVVTGPVLVLSEMHADDDFAREATILDSLQLDRGALTGRYFRLPLMTAAGDQPALLADEWLSWITRWLREREAILLVVDTATGASQIDPWGKEIQEVYRRLRGVLAAYPALAIVLLVHMKQPQGRGERRLSDVLGEWARWCDVVMLLERDGPRTRVSTRKRVRQERRLAARKSGGLLLDPADLEERKGTKVPADAVLAAIEARPGLTYRELGIALGVSKDSATRYGHDLGDRIIAVATGPKGMFQLYPAAAPTRNDAGTGSGGDASVPPDPAE